MGRFFLKRSLPSLCAETDVHQQGETEKIFPLSCSTFQWFGRLLFVNLRPRHASTKPGYCDRLPMKKWRLTLPALFRWTKRIQCVVSSDGGWHGHSEILQNATGIDEVIMSTTFPSELPSLYSPLVCMLTS